MELETFFEQFELLADAPNGVQKLRQLILQLAVQGKLVPQNPNDEPAEVLLERIREEKKRLVKEKKIQNSKSLPPVEEDEYPYVAPLSWEWAKIDHLCFVTKLAGFEYTKYIHLKDEGEVPVIRAQNVRMNKIDSSNLRFIELKTSIA
jgi:type I restriction enzyme S subunit